jgi:heme-degrading monooxygenase HmoA
VVFTSRRSVVDEGYGAVADRMVELASQQPGFLGVESARGPDGVGITVSYWVSPEAIAAWKAHVEHRVAQADGRRKWYADFEVRICRVERAYRFP